MPGEDEYFVHENDDDDDEEDDNVDDDADVLDRPPRRISFPHIFRRRVSVSTISPLKAAVYVVLEFYFFHLYGIIFSTQIFVKYLQFVHLSIFLQLQNRLWFMNLVNIREGTPLHLLTWSKIGLIFV